MTFPVQNPAPSQAIPEAVAIAPLLGNKHTEEYHWLGASLSKLLTEQLESTGINILAHDAVAVAMITGKKQLPLTPADVQHIARELNLSALIHGRFTLDETGKMLGLNLTISSGDISPVPFEVATPLASFSRFIDRMAITLLDKLGKPITNDIRQAVSQTPCPESFEALQQVSRARMAWSKEEHELALTALESALALDKNYEEAIAIKVAIARHVGDSASTEEAFRQWADLARKRGQTEIVAERFNLLGHWLMEQAQWGNARQAYNDALSTYQRLNDEENQTLIRNNIANLDLLEGRTQQAVKLYRRSLRELEQNPDTREDAALTNYNLSVAHKNLGQPQEALRAIEQALRVTRATSDTRLLAHCMAQRGAIYDDLGEWGKATQDYIESARLLDTVGDELGRAIIMSHQALLQKRQGAHDRAVALLKNAMDILKASPGQHRHDQAILELNLSEVYYSMEQFDRAWEHAERAEKVLSELKSAWLENVREVMRLIEEATNPTESTTSAQIDTFPSVSPSYQPSPPPLENTFYQQPVSPPPSFQGEDEPDDDTLPEDETDDRPSFLS